MMLRYLFCSLFFFFVLAEDIPADANVFTSPIAVTEGAVIKGGDSRAEINARSGGHASREALDDRFDDFGSADYDDKEELTGISCALITGDCTACAKTAGCGFCSFFQASVWTKTDLVLRANRSRGTGTALIMSAGGS